VDLFTPVTQLYSEERDPLKVPREVRQFESNIQSQFGIYPDDADGVDEIEASEVTDDWYDFYDETAKRIMRERAA